ncbi:putative Leucine-rich receptor-like kinase family protein [Melia azedarach]|nr:putative Leucine-rich receptor-like kinase family protein [Melia azedarach]
MSKNHLEGDIPIQLTSLERLEVLDISENRLFGYISSSFSLSSIKHIHMQNNVLTGSIPNVMFRSSRLMTLDLRNNMFSGGIPHQIKEHLDLRVLLLGGNHLQESIPNQLCQLNKLGILDISHNRLNGSIPSCFTNVSFWKVGSDDLYGEQIEYSDEISVGFLGTYYKSRLDLSVDGEMYVAIDQRVRVEFVTKNRHELYNGSNLNYMAGLDLSSNELIGEILYEIGELQAIRGLNLSHNFLSSSIPESFCNMKLIESLDLSYNKLSGEIPP